MNYIVKKGDWLSKIAQKYNVSVSELARLNNISDINRIEVGQNLILPTTNKTSKTQNWSPNKTKNSVLNNRAQSYNYNNQKWEYVEDCSRWANDALRKFNDGKTYGRWGVGGDAWTRNSEGRVRPIYSGYTNNVDLNLYKQVIKDVQAFKIAEKQRKGSGKITKAMLAINPESDKLTIQHQIT